jgi:hypothetical protein
MRKKRWPLFTGIGLAILVVLSFVVAPLFAAKPVYETYKVENTSVTKTVSANGQLAETRLLAYGPAEQPSLISVNGSVSQPVQFGASLEIKSVKVSVGKSVKKNQWLFTYVDQIGRDVKVNAVAAGVVRSIDSTAGLRTSGAVVTVGSDSPVVSVFVSEYDADLVAIDQSATIELDAISATFEGVVTRIGQVAQSLSGIKQYEVLLKVADLPEGARFGMSATAEIKVLTKDNVLAIPLNALVGDEGTLVDVLITDAGGNQTVKRVEIELGIFGDSFAEVTKGLKDGDQVITGVSGDVPAPVNFGPPPGARTGA